PGQPGAAADDLGGLQALPEEDRPAGDGHREAPGGGTEAAVSPGEAAQGVRGLPAGADGRMTRCRQFVCRGPAVAGKLLPKDPASGRQGDRHAFTVPRDGPVPRGARLLPRTAHWPPRLPPGGATATPPRALLRGDGGEDVDRDVERQVEPDVNVLRAERPTPATCSAGGVAVAQATATSPLVVTVPHSASRETYLNIYTRLGDQERIVTTIEVLSPVNQTPGEKARELYLKKQREVLDGQVHLLEIDLLLGGTHSSGVPRDRWREQVSAYDYHVCIHHFDNLEDFFIYPARLEGRLPAITVPLLPGDGSVSVDLQAAFDRAYDTGPY